MNQYGIMSDIHAHNWSLFSKTMADGMNSRLFNILRSMGDACDELLASGGTNMYIAGDLFHVRGSITPSVLTPTLDFFKAYMRRGVNFRIIPGNHDLEGKNSERLTNAITALEAIGCHVCNAAQVFEDDMIIMIPWAEKLSDLRDQIATLRDDINDTTGAPDQHEGYSLIIHAPLNGVLKNLPDHGLDPEELADFGFHRVFCGHYHNFKDFGNGVYSIGALTHQTWGDVETTAGFLMVSDMEVKQQSTEAPLFIDFDLDWDDAEAEMACSGNYVRVKLASATEAEIKVIRERIIAEYKADGVIVQAQPKVVTGARTSSVSSGASLGVSIKEWIDSNVTEDKNEVYDNCQAILADIEEVEE